MRAIYLVSCLGVALAPTIAGAATLGGPAPPVTPYVDRGLMLGQAQGYAVFGVKGSTEPIRDSTLDTSIGLGVGVTNRVSIDGSVGTLSLAPAARYRSPNVGLWVGLVDTKPFELDATARLTFGVGEGKIVSSVEPGAASIFRLAHVVRIDLGAYLPIEPGAATKIGLRLPVSVGTQLGPYLHLLLSSGVAVEDLGAPASSTTIPLGVALGVSAPLPGGGGIGLTPSVSWPRLADTGALDNKPRAIVVGATLSLTTP